MAPPARPDTAVPPPAPSFGEALRFWTRLGLISFGGPAAQIAIMHTELVERRRWISERRFLHALNYCMLLPGPEAQQLATYLGWLLHRTWGGIVAGALFVLPSLFILVALSWVYVAFGNQPLVAGLFYGIKPAVTALVVHAAHRIGTRVLKNGALAALAAASFVAIAVFEVPFPAIVAAAALLGAWGGRARPAWFAAGGGGHGAAGAGYGAAVIDDDTPPPAHARFSRAGLWRVAAIGAGLWAGVMAVLWATFGTQGLFTQMSWFFTKAALLTFGGAYAVLPYVYQGAVDHHQWLTAPQMIDGLALGETTPGPLIMVVAFVAFVGAWAQPVWAEWPFASAATAAALVTFFTFLPSFVFILAGGPMVESTRGRLGFTAPLTAITAAVVGVIAALAVFFTYHVWWPAGFDGGPDAMAMAITAAAAVALFRFKVGVIPLIAGCAAIGLAASLLLG